MSAGRNLASRGIQLPVIEHEAGGLCKHRGIDVREGEVLYYWLKHEGLLREVVDRGVTAVLPLHKGWDRFRASFDVCPTLTARGKFFVLTPHMLRPLLPQELFSLQGMPLRDLVPHGEPDVLLKSIASWSDVRSMVGMAFHTPSALGAFATMMLSAP